MTSHGSDLQSVSKAEESLFDTEMPSIELCEEYLLANAPPPSPSAPALDTSLGGNSVLPDWFDRPGAAEAVEVGADLCQRYGRLHAEIGMREDDGAQLLQRVLSYEAEYTNFKDWLDREKEHVQSLSPMVTAISEIRQQIKEVEVSVSWDHVTSSIIMSVSHWHTHVTVDSGHVTVGSSHVLAGYSGILVCALIM